MQLRNTTVRPSSMRPFHHDRRTAARPTRFGPLTVTARAKVSDQGLDPAMVVRCGTLFDRGLSPQPTGVLTSIWGIPQVAPRCFKWVMRSPACRHQVDPPSNQGGSSCLDQERDWRGAHSLICFISRRAACCLSHIAVEDRRPGSGFRTDDRGVGRPWATSCQVVYDDDHVIHNTQLAAASAGVTSFGSLMAICAALSDSALR